MNSFSNESDLPSSELKLQEQNVVAWRRKLEAVVTEILLSPGDDDAHLILAMTDYRLKMFRLRHAYEPREIFLEAYRRAVQKIESGEEIRNIPAWFRATIFNIIREHSKSKDNHHVPLPDNKDFPALQHSCEAIEHEVEVRWLFEAIEELNSEDKEVIHLRMKGLTYKEMSEHLKLSEEALRQKFHRALKKLRKMYSR